MASTSGSTRRQALLCGVLLGLLVAACSSSSPSVDTATGSRPTHAPARVTTLPASPATTTTFRSLRQAVIRVENADGMVAVAGGLWVKTDDGRAVRIDPRTNKVTDKLSLDEVSDPSTYCQGIGTDGTSVWACAADDDGTAVAQIDPAGVRVVRRVQVGKVFDQLSLPGTARGIWVLTGDGSAVQLVDPATGRATTYPLGAACQQLAAAGDRLVATGSVTNALVLMNAADGTTIGRLQLRSPRIVTLFGDDAWVDTDDGLTRIGPDLVIHAVYPDLLATGEGDVVSGAGSIWVRTGDGTISRIDPSTGQVAQRITPDRPLTAGSLYIAFGSIWATSGDDGRVVRLRLDG